VRVNDDPSGSQAWQWFGTMSVSPDGRIDAVWNDSRTTADSSLVALFYASSTDGGATWSINEQASPVWNSQLGWPNQAKIGDYYHMVSDVGGADLAWAATFNGEEDIYYTRITGQTTAVADEPTRSVRLYPNLPNPFASSTALRYAVPLTVQRVQLELFDLGGRRVATLFDGHPGGGMHTARWDGRDEAGHAARSGVYLCRLDADGVTETRRLMLLRR